MKLFRRNKHTAGDQGPVIPEEIQEYYQTEQRERVGVAWLLAVATFAVVVIGVLGLFFAGKWAYHALKKDNNNVATTSQNQPSDTSSTNTSNNSNSGTPAPSNTSTTSPTTNNTTVPSTSTPPTSSVSGNKQLTNTGPGDVVELFATTSVAGTAAYSLYTSRRRQTK